MADMARQFRRLVRRRLVILGEPGMGKTTLAVLLLRELLEHPQTGDPVPVMVSISGWDPSRETLRRWLARRISEDYPSLRAADFGSDAAKALVDQRYILPILDGLDELPASARPKVLSTLNKEMTAADAVIITCRTAEYAAAVFGPRGDVLTSGAVIEPSPVTAADAFAYLSHCLPPESGGDWLGLLAAVKANQESAIAQALTTPLALWLLRKVYIDTHAELIDLRDTDRFPTADAIMDHLLNNLVQAAIRANPPSSPDSASDHPFRPRHAWDPRDAKRWLSFLAHHLDASGTKDLAWWQLHGSLAHRWNTFAIGVIVGVPTGLAVGLTGGLIAEFTGALDGTLAAAVMFGLVGGLTGGLTGGLMFGLILELMKGAGLEPAYAELRLRGHVRLMLRDLVFGIAVGLPVCLTASLALAPADGFKAALTFGLMVGSMGGFAVGLNKWISTPLSSDRPGTPVGTLRRDLRLMYVRSLVFGLVLGLAFGSAAALTGRLAVGLMGGLRVGLEGGLAFGLAGGVVFALTFGLTGASTGYLITVSILFIRRSLPFKLMSFLEDAHRLGLLRQAGSLYQFRHAKLQDYLARISPSVSDP